MNTLKEIADLARSINNHTAVITAEDEREYNNNITAAAVAVYNENMFSENGNKYAAILSKSNIIK